MSRIIIQRDQEGLLTGNIESDLQDEKAGWTISETLAQAIVSELENNVGSEYSADIDPVYQEALSMLRGDEGMKTLTRGNKDHGLDEFE